MISEQQISKTCSNFTTLQGTPHKISGIITKCFVQAGFNLRYPTNSDPAKDICPRRPHLKLICTSSIVNLKGGLIWSINASLFLHVLCNYLSTPEGRLRVYFPPCTLFQNGHYFSILGRVVQRPIKLTQGQREF